MWYLFQLLIIGYITYIYKTSVSPETPLGYIVLFAFIVSYLATWFLNILLLRALRLAKRLRKVLTSWRPTK